MRELSLHILDIMENSIRAEATQISLHIQEDIVHNDLIIKLEDNGKGMTKEMLSQVKNPFATTRTLRKVGLGIPLLNQLCVECGGGLEIHSEEGKGTQIIATLLYDHIDRLPLGNMPLTLTTLILAKPSVIYLYSHIYNEKTFDFSTEEIKKILDGVPIEELSIIKWLEDYITEGLEEIRQS